MSEINDAPVPERKKPLRNPKKPLMQKKVKFASEIDLWNLEEGDVPLQLESTRLDVKRQTHIPPRNEVATVVEEVAEIEVVDIVETTKPSKEVPMKSSTARKIEKDTPVISAKVRYLESDQAAVAKVVPPQNGEANHLWAELDDQVEPQEEVPTERALPAIEEVSHIAAPLVKAKPAAETKPEVVKTPYVPPVFTPAEAVKPSEPKISRPAETASIEPEPPLEETHQAPELGGTVDKPARRSFFASLSMLEKIASMVFLSVLSALAIYAVIYFNSNVKEVNDPYAKPHFPVQGKYVTVVGIDSYWRTPIKSGPNADAVKLKVISIPELRITIPENAALAGALRVKFYDGAGNAIGDTVTRALNGGTFQTEREALFACTAGFSTPEEMDSYRAAVDKPWRVQVFEADRYDAPLSEFSLLFSAPISTAEK